MLLLPRNSSAHSSCHGVFRHLPIFNVETWTLAGAARQLPTAVLQSRTQGELRLRLMLLAFSPLPLPSLWFLQLQLPALWPLLLTSGTAATAFWCSIYFTAPPLHCLRYGDARTLHMKCQLRDGLSPEGEPCELIEDEQLDAITRINNTKYECLLTSSWLSLTFD